MNDHDSREKQKQDAAKGELLVYQTDDGRVRLNVRLEDETVWLTQQMIAELFQTTVPNVSMHIRNIYQENELDPKATIKKFLTVRREGDKQVRRREYKETLAESEYIAQLEEAARLLPVGGKGDKKDA